MIQQRYDFIDKMKGLAMIFVVMCHTYIFSFANSDFYGYSFVMSMELQIFMFCSGFLLYKPYVVGKKEGFKILAIKVRKLLIPFMLWGSLFTVFYAYKLHDEISINTLINNYINRFWGADIKNGYWYLFVLAFFISVEKIAGLRKQRNLIFDLLICLCIYMVFIAVWKLGGIYSSFISSYMWVLYYPFFILGYMVRKHKLQKFMLLDISYTFALIGYVLFFFITGLPDYILTIRNRLLLPLFAIIVIQKLLVERENRKLFIDKALRYFGKNTLDIYVFHYFIVTSIDLRFVVNDWGGA